MSTKNDGVVSSQANAQYPSSFSKMMLHISESNLFLSESPGLRKMSKGILSNLNKIFTLLEHQTHGKPYNVHCQSYFSKCHITQRTAEKVFTMVQ